MVNTALEHLSVHIDAHSIVAHSQGVRKAYLPTQTIFKLGDHGTSCPTLKQIDDFERKYKLCQLILMLL